ncbi:Gibberellin 3-beta-dioxygenase 2-3 [Rhynchospora pubera]|uniref:Gibberellin 3-beta-dioxygenase 2-3 n=1 Tax=Rhynchospora pubera TaxID=906938 RepID=A0AAV8HUN2_9POAL|nr:Gibberellin 3-beta-dioxygenase 2-3 [Rhynchospora pubera]
MALQASHSELKLHQPENFQFNSVPDSHDWLYLYDHPFADPIGPDSVPVIDLTDPKLIEKIGKACEEWGVFLITSHGIQPELLNQLGSQIHRLFALPTEVKLKVAKTEARMPGYGGVPSARFFPKFTWSEGFSITSSPREHAQKLWPDDYSSFCEVIEEYKKITRQLGCRLMHIMLLSLGLTEEEINHTAIGDSNKILTSMHLNSYPACPNPDRALGLVPHTDPGLVTILYQDRVSGLQVLRRKDGNGPARWVTVLLIPGTLVVNIGDLMHVLSNGRFHNVLHRAVVNKTDQWLSAGQFFVPPVDVNVGPLNRLITGSQPVYKSVPWLEYWKLRETLYDESLQAIKVDGHGKEGMLKL